MVKKGYHQLWRLLRTVVCIECPCPSLAGVLIKSLLAIPQRSPKTVFHVTYPSPSLAYSLCFSDMPFELPPVSSSTATLWYRLPLFSSQGEVLATCVSVCLWVCAFKPEMAKTCIWAQLWIVTSLIIVMMRSWSCFLLFPVHILRCQMKTMLCLRGAGEPGAYLAE